YDALTAANVADVAVVNNDNDAAGINVSLISGPTTESGGTATFTVTLASQPSGNVTIPLTSSDLTEGMVPANVTITPALWQTGVQVTVTGVDDMIIDGNVAYTIVTGDPTSTDATYDALTAANVVDVAVVNNDNDAIHHAPAGTDKTVTMVEDGTYTIVVSDFGFTDTDDSPGDTLLAVKITTLPTAGSLQLNSLAVTAGQMVTAADLDANKLTFAPAAQASGTTYASFTFQVQDNGGTADGGVDLDPTANQFTFNVTARLHPWQNVRNVCDVDDSNLVTPLDVLLIINYINTYGSGPISASVGQPRFVDVSGDDLVTALDVLMVINYINLGSSAASGGEGKSVFPVVVGSSSPLPVEVEGQLAYKMIVADGQPTSAVAGNQNDPRQLSASVGVSRLQRETILDDAVSSPRFGELEELLFLLAKDVAGNKVRI
ncbi:MAG: dockerin type I domain-containing protein, partial [Planctomycetota bacterium]|nr:dockerin type I domain-containing protein [Planctomycetota bacterium]